MLRIERERLIGKPVDEVTLEDVTGLGALLGDYFGGERTLFVSGRDFYPASRMFKRALTAGLMSNGVEVLDFHESINGEIAFSIKRFGARGGFSIVQDPYDPVRIMIRIFKAPGVEIVGGELEKIISKERTIQAGERKVGWVNYAEYIHKLYVSALTSFVKTDVIIDEKLSIVAGSSRGALDIILPELFTSIKTDSIVFSTRKMIEERSGYPLIDEMLKTAKIVDALNAHLGVIFNNDASSLTVYTKRTGFLLPEELGIILLSRYRPGSKILVDKWWNSKYVEEIGSNYHVVRANGEEEFFMKLRREQPVLAINGKGEVVIPLFSLGYDGLLGFMALLEAISLSNKDLWDKIVETRSKLAVEGFGCFDLESIVGMCAEKGASCVKFAGGIRVERNNVVYTYLYDPSRNCYREIA
ncbi:phosphoglucomutase/phosphomannomutase alpha/beta/alpha domain I [Thermosphaera aggregans]|jgi:phosphomannomutase|uniref:Phosphoglucomutase/phosphomannomutase alpha/beta/alpha domain I n=1 Tax=Thermosphaera aggregans (strain DSM 11486 / M11TL) TaxID=633148 RepID=D5U0T3_THEAM|nr:phosphoglucomutase/phosphomannomutase alpha/beta/alpha domain I [Thermosphaera aggregans]ADG90733.1 phosphoglucomutase/phosphomannomutase alpha/beta/alpha domain I [Thermosphaera aggregans DSM 11486]